MQAFVPSKAAAHCMNRVRGWVAVGTEFAFDNGDKSH